MKFYALPLVFLVPAAAVKICAWLGIGAVTGAGVTAYVMSDKVDKPPYESPFAAYNNYVISVEKGDYQGYQWTVVNPMSKDDFETCLKKREECDFAKIKEGPGDISIYNKKTEGRAKALSPWNRKEEDFLFKRSGASWKVVEKR